MINCLTIYSTFSKLNFELDCFKGIPLVLHDALCASANVGGVNFGGFDPILPVVVTIVDVKYA